MVEILGWEISQGALLNGAVAGLTYALLAAGFVLIYRSTGVLNFAQAEIGAIAVAVLVLLHIQYNIPYWVSFVLAVLASGAFALLTELIVVRRLFNAPRLVLFIATLGVAQIALLLTISMPEVSTPGPYPLPPWFDSLRWEVTDDLRIGGRELLIIIVAPTMILLLAWFLNATRFGLAVRASAENAETSRLFGISVKRTSTIVWTIAGLLAGITGVLIAPLRGVTAARAGTAGLGPGLLLRVLTVALLARMRSLPMTLAAGLGVGLVEGIALRNLSNEQRSAVDVYLFIAVLVIVLITARSAGGEDEGDWSLSPKVKAVPERLRNLWYVKRLPAIGLGLLFGGAALLGVVLSQPSQLFLWSRILLFAFVSLSLSMLIGWAGQLSLGQFAFVGLGGLTTVAFYTGSDIPVPFDLWDMSYELPWGAAIAIGTATGVVAAVIVGLPALRVRGLFLAVTTLAFAVAASSWLFVQDVFLQGRTTVPALDKPIIGPFDLSSRKTFYFAVLVVLILGAMMVAHLRKTGIGRMMIAVRDNPDMAASSTVSGTRVKLTSFALAGGMAAFAGGLLVTLLPGFGPEITFQSEESIRIIAIAIIGGLGTVVGPILGALWVLGLPALFGETDEIRLLTSGVGLLLLLMYFPGGLVQIAYNVRDDILGLIDRRLADRGVEAKPVPAIEKRVPTHDREIELPAPGEAWLATHDVTVRFGGKVAVHDVSITVGQGELVGLIGANGAGKSTLMNAISGFVPFSGRIDVLGREITGLPAYRRHRIGLGRGFQSARLYPDLTVRESLMVSMEARERSLLVPSMLAFPPSPRAERRKTSDTEELMDFVGLGRYADQFISNLSTGTRRIVELASLLAVDAKVLLLDEPTGGVAQKETEAFGPLIRRIQAELGASVVVIEHDMPLVMSISDRVYCLEAGEVIAEGDPDSVRNDPLVIASYLGTDERAIARSNA